MGKLKIYKPGDRVQMWAWEDEYENTLWLVQGSKPIEGKWIRRRDRDKEIILNEQKTKSGSSQFCDHASHRDCKRLSCWYKTGTIPFVSFEGTPSRKYH